MQRVHHKRQDSFHFRSRYRSRQYRRLLDLPSHCPGPSRFVGKVADVLQLVIVVQLKILTFEPGSRLACFIGYYDIDLNKLGAYPYHAVGAVFRLLLRNTRARKRRKRKQACDHNDAYFSRHTVLRNGGRISGGETLRTASTRANDPVLFPKSERPTFSGRISNEFCASESTPFRGFGPSPQIAPCRRYFIQSD